MKNYQWCDRLYRLLLSQLWVRIPAVGVDLFQEPFFVDDRDHRKEVKKPRPQRKVSFRIGEAGLLMRNPIRRTDVSVTARPGPSQHDTGRKNYLFSFCLISFCLSVCAYSSRIFKCLYSSIMRFTSALKDGS